ncbi:MAG TPA: NAD(P)/FAD-dependent oxidoreductase [Rhodothermales bacterium]|nr:NAD(P)/FAD-dependent oxidoreductase [Rhodothermales bacterium]
MSENASRFDAVVVGGGPAGLSAALTLGRSRRRVLLAADGPTRNAPAHAAHNVFTRDGTPPAELVRIGRAQLAPYAVSIREEWVTDAERTDAGFAVTFAGGGRVEARALVLATGVRDVMPDVPGFAELWGSGVFHCPYCHGWEVAGQPLAIYARGETALHFAQLIRGWTDDLILITDGPSGLSAEDRAKVERNGIVVREERVERLVGTGGRLEAVVFAGGEAIPRAGLFLRPEQELRSDLPHRLACPLSADGRVQADAAGKTPVPGVFVAGDVGPGWQSVPSAIASGALAGAMLNAELLAQEFER